MIQCLENFIGLRGACNNEVPPSGLFINDLPGMSIARLESVSNAEDDDANAVWAKVYGRACDNMCAEVVANMPEDMRANKVLESVSIGRTESEVIATSAAAEYRGVLINASGSQHLKLLVDSIKFYAGAGGAVTFKIFDAHDGMELYTTTKTVVAGWNQIDLSQFIGATGTSIEAFVCYDASAVDSIETSGQSVGRNISTAQGAKIDSVLNVIEANIDLTGETYGLIVRYQTLCGVDSFICDNKMRLANALRYKAGIELLVELIMTPSNVNSFTLVDREQMKYNIGMYQDYYEGELRKALSGIEPTRDQVCFVCQSAVNIRAALPG